MYMSHKMENQVSRNFQQLKSVNQSGNKPNILLRSDIHMPFLDTYQSMQNNCATWYARRIKCGILWRMEAKFQILNKKPKTLANF